MSSRTATPDSSTAFERSRRSSSFIGTRGDSKYFPSGHTRTRVPVWRPQSPSTRTGLIVSPPSAKSMRWILPSRLTSTSMRVDSALVTDTPTPCRPPEKA